jgi:sugar lactone lactonase YvrE
VNLAAGSATVLLDASDKGFPSGFVYVSKTSAVLGFDFTGSEVYQWDPTKSRLGDPIAHAPDTFTYDGAGNLLGTVTKSSKSGVSTTSVVSVVIATGKSTTLDGDPFTQSGGFVGGVDVWPHP